MEQLKQIPVGRFAIDVVTKDGLHWMFNDADTQLRLVNWWPSTARYSCPQSKKSGVEKDEDEVLRIAIAESKDKLFRSKAKLIGKTLVGVELGHARRARQRRQAKQIYGDLPKPRRR